MNHSLFKRSSLLCLVVLFSACRQSPEPSIEGPWSGTLTKDNQTIETLKGNMEYVSDSGLAFGHLSGLGEVFSVVDSTSNGPANTGNLTATTQTRSLNCTSDLSMSSSSYTGTCTLTKNGQTTSGYTLALRRIY